MPRQWWSSLSDIGTIIENKGPWPSPSPESTGIFLPLDVDRYDHLAIVVGHGPNGRGREVLGVDEFQEAETGVWQYLGGGGSSHALDERRLLQDAKQALHLRMSGVTGEFPMERRRYSFAIFLCGPEVTTVRIHRQLGTRTADVSSGLGWLGVLWIPNDPASLIACTADGTQSFTWTSPDGGPA